VIAASQIRQQRSLFLFLRSKICDLAHKILDFNLQFNLHIHKYAKKELRLKKLVQFEISVLLIISGPPFRLALQYLIA